VGWVGQWGGTRSSGASTGGRKRRDPRQVKGGRYTKVRSGQGGSEKERGGVTEPVNEEVDQRLLGNKNGEAWGAWGGSKGGGNGGGTDKRAGGKRREQKGSADGVFKKG